MTILNKKIISLAINNSIATFAVKFYFIMKGLIFIISLSGAISHFTDCYN